MNICHTIVSEWLDTQDKLSPLELTNWVTERSILWCNDICLSKYEESQTTKANKIYLEVTIG